MTKKISFEIPYSYDLDDYLRHHFPDHYDYRVLSQSLDARGAPRGRPPHYRYELEVRNGPEESFSHFFEEFPYIGPLSTPPIIIGSGPAGLFCALRLAEYGIPSIIFERGEAVGKRMVSISRYWRQGVLDPDSNVCFGEGGAGLFSDGKLLTRIKSPHVSYVMNRMGLFGAPPEVEYRRDPHVGSNKIRKVIIQLTEYLKSKGVQFHYRSRVKSLIYSTTNVQKVVGVELESGKQFYSPHVVLAVGHSAHELYHHLDQMKVALRPKAFAVGVRIEHPRRYIDGLQYGSFADDQLLGAARYRLSHEDQNSKRGTYTFCMCPGGYILSSSTEKESLVVNGMSNYARNSPWSNSGVVAAVTPLDFPHMGNLGGLDFQAQIEHKSYLLSKEKATGKEIPAVTLKEFLDGRLRPSLPLPTTTCPSGIFREDLEKIFPSFITDHLRKAFLQFEKKLKGFALDKALLLAPESRTSSPVTILRDPESLESTTHEGLFPCGEGAGYAGGITSAAVDGVKVAMTIVNRVKFQN